jgi:hypothetical protein
VQAALQALEASLQRYGPQDRVALGAQAPFPSQAGAGVYWSPEQDADPTQVVVWVGKTQSPLALQLLAPHAGSEVSQAAPQQKVPRQAPDTQAEFAELVSVLLQSPPGWTCARQAPHAQ